MAYYIRARLRPNGEVNYGTSVLIESSVLGKGRKVWSDSFLYERVDGAYAHRWVRCGHIHETPLYIDQGRIRYAREGS